MSQCWVDRCYVSRGRGSSPSEAIGSIERKLLPCVRLAGGNRRAALCD